MERSMLLGIKARAERQFELRLVLEKFIRPWLDCRHPGHGLPALRAPARGWAWGLLPLAYAIAILGFTADAESAMAGFLWWGIIPAGFLLFGRRWFIRTGAGYRVGLHHLCHLPLPAAGFRAALPGNRAGGRCRLGSQEILGGKKGTPAF